jgi:NAD(P)-dependent dehydrogenase (short-subunit alcohol dehydrogenase family)
MTVRNDPSAPIHDNSRFRGQVAVVTGGGDGIGRAVCLRLAAEGASVAVLDIDAPSARETVREVTAAGGAAVAIECDVTDEQAVADAMEATVSSCSRLDVLINNAGIATDRSCTDTTLDNWNRVLAVNLTGAFLCAKHAIPRMLADGGGVIVNVSALAALVGVKEHAAYAASKAGMLGLTRAITYDYSRQGIRCNAVCPATVPTPMLEAALRRAPDPALYLEQTSKRQFIGRLATMDEVCSPICFLASSESGYMHGACLPVDGGVTATSPPATDPPR